VNLLTNLISHYKCEEASGDLLDDHGANDWTDANAVAGGVAGKIGNCRDFEASSSVYFASNDSDFHLTASDMSVSAWIHLESTPASGAIATIISRGYDASDIVPYFLNFLNDAGTLKLQWMRYSAVDAGVSWTIAGVDFTDGFHHVVGTRSGTTWKLYVDGVEKASATGSLVTDTDTLTGIGGQVILGTPGRFLDGKLDEISIWSRALSADEVTFLNNSGSGRALENFVSLSSAALIGGTHTLSGGLAQ
jgi:large repetitive protein